jgi:DUF1680 family protein
VGSLNQLYELNRSFINMTSTKTGAALYPYARWHSLPLSAVSLTGGFWAQRQEINRQVSLQHGYQMLEQAGNLDNLRLAAGQIEGQFRGMIFQDSDIYKWLEAVGYELAIHPDAALQKLADGVIDLIAAAQQPDGYLNSYVQVVSHDAPWTDLDHGHELYCAGHLFQGAVAYHRGTGTTKLLEVATRFADLIAATFGPDRRQGACGHPEVETALVELYRDTGKTAYLDVARFFIDQRGKGVMRGMNWMKAEYHQDRVPIRQTEIVEGHAVRAMYLNAGVADIYLETGETALLTALDRQWHDLVSSKLFLTGGLGARYEGEAFGLPYELPADRCYCETCAAIGGVMWNWRMLLITGESRFADLMERTLYNGVLSGLALDGKHFFYMNPLLSRGDYTRQEWYSCACCPPNLMRTVASLGQYMTTHDASGIQIHLYNSATIRTELGEGRTVELAMETDYPWQGQVKIAIQESAESAWQLRLRIPEWCPNPTLAINGEVIQHPTRESGYMVLDRVWKPGDSIDLDLPIEATWIVANPRVDAVRESVAIQRGPLVYCLEAIDQPEVNLLDVQVDVSAPLRAIPRDDLLSQRITTVQGTGYTLTESGWEGQLYRPLVSQQHLSRKPIGLTAIPYYVWANRGETIMRVWLPRAEHHDEKRGDQA